MIHQLRFYAIFEHNKTAFHERFRDHAWRIMGRYGFRVLAFWESRSSERTEFIYLLEWDDEAQLEQAWAAFLADEEWKEIKRVTAARHGDLVGEVTERRLTPTSYTPGLVGAGPPRPEAASRVS